MRAPDINKAIMIALRAQLEVLEAEFEQKKDRLKYCLGQALNPL